MLVLALGIVPNVAWRGTGFAGACGFPLAHATFRDYGPQSMFHHPERLLFNAVFILAVALGTAIIVLHFAGQRLIVPRQRSSLAAAVPFVMLALPRPWPTALVMIGPVAILAWHHCRPGLVSWLLAVGLFGSITVLSYPAGIVLADDVSWSSGDVAQWFEIFFVLAVWLVWIAGTADLLRARPRVLPSGPSVQS